MDMRRFADVVVALLEAVGLAAGIPRLPAGSSCEPHRVSVPGDETMSHSVYISYAVRDKVVADAACACLEARGLRCWIAPRDVPPGLSRADALARAIGAAGVFVLVWSASSNASEQVIREVALATEARIPVLPFRIQDVQPSKEIGYFVRTIHWLDALTPPLEKHLRTLADSVQRLLGIPHLEAAPDHGGAARGARPTCAAAAAPRLRRLHQLPA